MPGYRAGLLRRLQRCVRLPVGTAGIGQQEGFAAGLGECADAQDIGLAFRHRDDAAGIQQVEDVAGLDALVIGRQHAAVKGTGLMRGTGGQKRLAFLFRIDEMAVQHLGVGEFEVVAGIFLLGLQEDIAIADLVGTLAAVEVQVIDVVHALHIHGETLQTIGEFA